MNSVTKKAYALAVVIGMTIAGHLSYAQEAGNPDPDPIDPTPICSTLEPTVCDGTNIGTWPWCNDGPAGCCWGKTVEYRCSDNVVRDYEFRYLGSNKICDEILAQCKPKVPPEPIDPGEEAGH